MGGAVEVDIRSLAPADLPAVGALFAAHAGREADLSLIGQWIDEAPSAAATGADGLVGFLFCRRFAPDVAEVANLLVAPEHRGRGVGAALLASVEEAAPSVGYRAMIVVQSSLYRVTGPAGAGSPAGGGDVGPTGIYARHGYRDVLTTGPTVVSVKPLDAG